MNEKQFKKSVSGTLATGIILEKELSTDEVLNELIKLEKENKELKKQVDEMINIFNDSGLDYHISDELEEILND